MSGNLRNMDLGKVGIWSGVLRRGDPGEAAEAAVELESLGFGALWIPGGAGGHVLGDSLRLMDATTRVVVATGILNIWMYEAADVAAGHAALTEQHPGRFLLGLGVSHAPAVERANQSYTRPFSKMVDYLDQLDAASPAVPHEEMALAALGPKMLRLSAERTAGAHPYFVPPEHTAIAREALGDGPLLATEQMVVLETDAATARDIARTNIARYLDLPNYTNNLRALGFTVDDLTPPGTDRLVDAIVAWGDESAIRGSRPGAPRRRRRSRVRAGAARRPRGVPSHRVARHRSRTDLPAPRRTFPMKYTHLGRTGLTVSRICLGTMNFGPQTDEAESDLIMDRAIDEGINFFDTANVYGFGDRKGMDRGDRRPLVRAGRRTSREDGHRHEALRRDVATGRTTRCSRRGTSATRARHRSAGCRPTTSTCTRCITSTGSRRGTRSGRRWRRSCNRARSCTPALRTSPAGTW